MDEQSRLSWEIFTRTGEIEAYLLYKSMTGFKNNEDKDNTWQVSEQEALS